MFNWDFAQPLWLIGLLVIPLGWTGIYLRRKRRFNAYTFSSNQQLPASSLGTVRAASSGLSWLALAFVFTALARPQSSQMFQQPSQNLGIDLMMALDISTSMLARDLKPNRLEALKTVATDFVAQRTMDRLGLVIYAGEAYSPVPLTTDQSLLSQQISTLHHEMLEGGTAIGMGLSTAVNRLVESTAKSKVIILLTDGENNGGLVDPVQAAELAASLNIKVYTIGLGTNGMASTPVMKDPRGNLIYQPRPVTIDEDLLKRIADITGGQYFRATDNERLAQIYNSIDQLEKSEIEGFEFYRYTEHFSIFLYLALACIALELLLNFVLLKTAF